MHRDPTNQYRSLLLTQDVLFPDRVDTPWVSHPDLGSFNQAAYNRVVRLLTQMRNHAPTEPAQSQGLLILGEAGTGKTHLLMRVARRLARDNYILFVPRPNNPGAVYLHIWTNTLQSLTRTLPERNKSRSQLDDLLAHVFSAVLIPELEGEKSSAEHRRWAARLREDPFNLFTMLGEGQKRESNLRALRNRTLSYLRTHHPLVDRSIAYALITYCLTSDANRQRALLTWLSGQDVLDDLQLGLPENWVGGEGAGTNSDLASRREDMALRAIQSLAILSTYYQPLILAFDQLEGLRHQPEVLTLRWADAVREIVTQLPNLLVITCVFPSLWKDWFGPRIESSASQRIAAHKVELEKFTAHHGRQMLALNLEPAHLELRLPSPIYPFEEADITSLCPPEVSPRQFIQAARDQFNSWLDGVEDWSGDVPALTSSQSIEQVLGDVIQGYRAQAVQNYARGIPVEEDQIGRIENLASALLAGRQSLPSFDQASREKRVMPLNFIAEAEDGHRLCVAVLNSTGRSATARLENLLHAANNTGQFDHLILIRDRRCPLPTTSTVAHQHLRALQQQGCVYLIADRDEVCRLDALYDTLGAVEQRDVSVGNHLVERLEFVDYVRNRGVAREAHLFAHAARLSQLFNEAVGAVWSPNPAPMQTVAAV